MSTAEPKRFGLPRTARLTQQHEFRRVYGRGRRAHGDLIVVVAFRRRDAGHRLGVAVSKEHGRAVRRNKIKRILREAFRLERPELPGQFDMVLIPRKGVERLSLEAVRNELKRLVAGVERGGSRGGRRRGRDSKRTKRAGSKPGGRSDGAPS